VFENKKLAPRRGSSTSIQVTRLAVDTPSDGTRALRAKQGLRRIDPMCLLMLFLKPLGVCHMIQYDTVCQLGLTSGACREAGFRVFMRSMYIVRLIDCNHNFGDLMYNGHTYATTT